jgi:hypothetical protein
MRDRLIVAPAVAMLVVIASGLYIVLPAVSYPIVVLAMLALFADTRFRAAPLAALDARRVSGTLMLLALFLIHSTVTPVTARTVVVVFNAATVGVVAYACWMRALDPATSIGRDPRRLIVACALAAMVLLLCGQFAETAGLVDRRALGSAERENAFALRPGGFHNPNMTAAIALVLLVALERATRGRRGLALFAALILCTAVVALAQSRACIGALALYMGWLSWRRRGTALVLLLSAVVVVSALETTGDVAALLGERMSERFRSDDSNDERARVLEVAREAIGDAPVLGNGYRYVERVAGVSTHNEPIEHLVNFGAIGLLVAIAAFVLIHLPASPAYLLIGVLPTLMFSHNFFDNPSLQIALAMALAVDRRFARSATCERPLRTSAVPG